MALDGRRPEQAPFWVEPSRLEVPERHPFYRRRNEIPAAMKFDAYVEQLWRGYYVPKTGRRSILLGGCFRCFLVGCFEAMGSDQGDRLPGVGLAEPAGLSGAELGGGDAGSLDAVEETPAGAGRPRGGLSVSPAGAPRPADLPE